MSWREQYQAGSFRGAAFRTQSHERSGGRRVQVLEMPSRDEPLVEDLGRRSRQFALEFHVIGADYVAARDKLIDALEAEGPGLLVHPWHGQMMVSVLDYRSTESTDDGGVCWFSVTFSEAGVEVTAPVAVASGQQGAAEADKQTAEVPKKLKKKFSIEDVAGFVEKSAADLVSGMGTVSQIAAGLQGGVGPALRAFEAGLSLLPANMQGLLRDPLSLGLSLVGLVSTVSALSTSSRRKISALTLMLDWEPGLPDFPDSTPNRLREAGNADALLAAFRVATAAELARTVSATKFTSYDDAVAVRDALTARFDRRALASADKGDDETADAFDALRRAVTRDIAARGANLARVYGLALPQTEAALVLANRVYGFADVETRAAEIVGRNRVLHPGFIPGGQTIQLLTAGDAELAAAGAGS